MLWTTAPVFISIVSFFTYVMQGNELTISKAFTVRPGVPRGPNNVNSQRLIGHLTVFYDSVWRISTVVLT